MKILKIVFFFASFIFICSNVKAQNVRNLFPHAVGNHWEYCAFGYSTRVSIQTITKDSVDLDNTVYLFYNNSNEYSVYIDTLNNVYEKWWGNNDFRLLYKLEADSGDIWNAGDSINPYWAQILKKDTIDSKIYMQVYFSRLHPDSIKDKSLLFYEDKYLKEGVGLHLYEEEPANLYGLCASIINGDTSGIITNVQLTSDVNPTNHKLFQNYPNPFNPTTTINYQIATSGFVQIKLYDLIGREVKTLVGKEQTPGSYNLKFNSNNLTSGIYLYSLEVGNFRNVKKMVILK